MLFAKLPLAYETENMKLLSTRVKNFKLSAPDRNNLGSVSTKPEKFENAAWLGLPSTLIRHKNGAFPKRSSNRRNLKTPALRLRVDGRHFENRAFRERWRHDNHVISLTDKPKMNGDYCVFKFLQRSLSGKHLMRFQSETSVSKFLRRSADGALVVTCASRASHSTSICVFYQVFFERVFRNQKYSPTLMSRKICLHNAVLM